MAKKYVGTTASSGTFVAWADLSDRGAWTLTNIEVPITFGSPQPSYAELGEVLGMDRKQVASLRHELRAEVARLAERNA